MTSNSEFRKSTSSHMECMEVRALSDGTVECRHSAHPGGPYLLFTLTEWRAFVDGAKRGEFDFGSAAAE